MERKQPDSGSDWGDLRRGIGKINLIHKLA